MSPKANPNGPPGSPTMESYQRVKGGAAEVEEPAPLPPEETIALERGAILVLSPMEVGVWRYSVRWPDAKEKDALLAAGGYRSDVTFGDRDAAEAAGMKAYEEGPRREAHL